MMVKRRGWMGCAAASRALAVVAIVMVGYPLGAAAETRPAPQDEAPEPVAPQQAEVPAKPENPGLINEIGKLFQTPTWTLPKMKSPSEVMGDWNAQAKGVTDALQGVGGGTVVKGRTSCPLSGHGAPDCKAASDNLCKSKGFKEGKSLDTDSARTCSPQALLTGRKLEERDCKTEHYVTRALCQ